MIKQKTECFFTLLTKSKIIQKITIFLAMAFLMVVFSACKKSTVKERSEWIDNRVASQLELSVVGINTLYYENAEGQWLNTSYAKLHAAATYSITPSTVQHFSGSKSIRFELRDSDPEVKNGTRSEISFPIATTNNRWYSYALYIPETEYKPDGSNEVISQWHQGGGVTPALCLRTKSDHLYLRILGTIWIDLGILDKDKWHAYVMHVIHSSENDGFIEIWRDGQKILNRFGANAYPINETFHLPYWKVGIYKSDWNGSGTTSTNKRVLYLDDIKIGNEKVNYTDMVPIGNNTTPGKEPEDSIPEQPSTPYSDDIVTDFVLVNSATEKDVLTIKEGQLINLRDLALKKINIRVITSTTGSVKFELTGTQRKTYIDNKAPYSLHGDDGSGNFYYGNWNPPPSGTFTLKAIPYQSDYAKGTVGTPKTITFTIKY